MCCGAAMPERTVCVLGQVPKNCDPGHFACQGEAVVCGLLTELAVYFLIYTEASSMRHTPELSWFLYWCLNHR